MDLFFFMIIIENFFDKLVNLIKFFEIDNSCVKIIIIVLIL